MLGNNADLYHWKIIYDPHYLTFNTILTIEQQRICTCIAPNFSLRKFLNKRLRDREFKSSPLRDRSSRLKNISRKDVSRVRKHRGKKLSEENRRKKETRTEAYKKRRKRRCRNVSSYFQSTMQPYFPWNLFGSPETQQSYRALFLARLGNVAKGLINWSNLSA